VDLDQQQKELNHFNYHLTTTDMKTRIIVLLAISAVATLSFTFKAGNKANKKASSQTAQQKQVNEPLGGFVSEDKF
jgi:hypothetical protein